MRTPLVLTTFIFSLTSTTAFAQADAPQGIAQQLNIPGKAWVDARYRYEHVAQDGIAKDANAHTLRTRLGYETEDYAGFKLLGEAESNLTLGEENFNSGTNNRTNYPRVTDPQGAEINRLHASYTHNDQYKATLGRQYIEFDNARHIGISIFRQNARTYDAARFDLLPTTSFNLAATYAYVDGVQSVLGSEATNGHRNHDTHLINLSADLGPAGQYTAYTYLIDNADVVNDSSATYGVRYTNSYPVQDELTLGVATEFAYQTDHGHSTLNYDARYYLAELAAKHKAVKYSAGYEIMTGQGGAGESFRTPLGRRHKHNGWADVFTNTPNTGLVDKYIKAETDFSFLNTAYTETKLELAYHNYDAEKGSAAYGQEFNTQLTHNFNQNVYGALKYANYDTHGFSRDVEKFWLTLGVKF